MKKNIKEIVNIAKELMARLSCCDICPRNCQIDRTKNQIGYCGGSMETTAYTAFKHQGEEPGISGKGGSGTIFFSGCNLRCVYCQNYRFSHTITGTNISATQLSKIMLNLEKTGADNINLVTPTHYLPQIITAVAEALINDGLDLPIVYNTSGYEKQEIITLLAPIIDIYLTDFRYADNKLALELSNASDYPQHATNSITQMYHQQKNAIYNKNGLLKSALIIRHLVLPNCLENTHQVLKWINQNTPEALVSVMFQYQPYHDAKNIPRINRPVNQREYNKVHQMVDDLEINGWVQDLNNFDQLAGAYFKPQLDDLLK
jgi:putative pyruvate formate lyase activating enzyme